MKTERALLKFQEGGSLIRTTAYLFSSATGRITPWPERIWKLEFIVNSEILLHAALMFLHHLCFPEAHFL